MEKWHYPAELRAVAQGSPPGEEALAQLADELLHQHDAIQWLLERAGLPTVVQKTASAGAPPFIVPVLPDDGEEWTPFEVDCNT